MKRLYPSQFVPATPADFIGGAARIGKTLAAKAKALRGNGGGTLKVLLYGQPGVGKTALANMVAGMIGSQFNLQKVNGRSVNVDLVRTWQWECHQSSLFDGYTVKIVDELDTCPPAAQDLLLTFLDDLPGGWAFIGTSNLDLNQLVARLQTRLQAFKVTPPESDEIVGLLKGFKIPGRVAEHIALGSGGNVRAALLDAESQHDFAHS